MMDKMYMLFFVVIVSIIILFIYKRPRVENFEVLWTPRPNWYNIPAYSITDWVVNTYPDAVDASCLPYNRSNKYGSLANINYLSSATRFWRF